MPTSLAPNVTGAGLAGPVIVVEPAVYMIFWILRATVPIVPAATVGNACVYVNDPVAVPSVEPTVSDVDTPTVVVTNPVAAVPASTGPMIGMSTVPVAPNVAPVAAMLSGDALTFSPIRNGATTPADNEFVQSAS
jgi:hypothetical protein